MSIVTTVKAPWDLCVFTDDVPISPYTVPGCLQPNHWPLGAGAWAHNTPPRARRLTQGPSVFLSILMVPYWS